MSELERRTGISRRHLYAYLIRRRKPTLATAVRLADGVGVKVDDLLSEQQAS
jgi:transcriptional regulator with XRE-family HTH domain